MKQYNVYSELGVGRKQWWPISRYFSAIGWRDWGKLWNTSVWI